MRARVRPTILAFTTAVLAAAAMTVTALAGGNGPPEPVPSKPAKPIPVVETLQMRPTKDPLKSLRGRVVMLLIFGTYYDACTASVPTVNALHDKFGPSGLTILWLDLEEERPKVEAWLAANGVKSSAAIVDTRTKEDLIDREYAVPGMPWAFVIDAKGNIVFAGNPRNWDRSSDDLLTPLLDATSQAPILPPGLIDVQAMLDAGTWTRARATLLASLDAGKLSKTDAGWAKGVAKWIEMRRTKTIAEGDAFLKQGWAWDAWWTYDDYTRRFETAEGCDIARQKADAVRATPDPAVKLDLTNGDDFAKAQDYIAKGKNDPARLILVRLSKLKTTRFAERAKELLATLPPK